MSASDLTNAGRTRLDGESRFPHVLIEGDVELTARLWEECAGGVFVVPPERRPIVLSPNRRASKLRNALNGNDPKHEANGNYYVKHVDMLSLLRSYPRVDRRLRPARTITRALSWARREFRLEPDQPVSVSLVGSHSSLTNQIRTGLINIGAQIDAERKRAYDKLIARRGMALRLMETLKAFGNVEPVWLAEAFDSLGPTDELPRELKEVVRIEKVRQRHDMIASTSHEAAIQPAIPVIYTQCARDPEWKRFEGLSWERPWLRAAPFASTGMLIEQFAEFARTERAGEPGLRAVLVKVLAEKNRCNPLDAPMITTEQLGKAKAAGISAVLLDGDHGIISRKEIKKAERARGRPAWFDPELARFEPDAIPVYRA